MEHSLLMYWTLLNPWDRFFHEHQVKKIMPLQNTKVLDVHEKLHSIQSAYLHPKIDFHIILSSKPSLRIGFFHLYFPTDLLKALLMSSIHSAHVSWSKSSVNDITIWQSIYRWFQKTSRFVSKSGRSNGTSVCLSVCVHTKVEYFEGINDKIGIQSFNLSPKFLIKPRIYC